MYYVINTLMEDAVNKRIKPLSAKAYKEITVFIFVTGNRHVRFYLIVTRFS